MNVVLHKKKLEQGITYYREKRYDQAIQLLFPYVNFSSNANLLYVVAQSFRQIKKFPQSLEVYGRLISLHKHPAFYCGYAGLLVDIGEVEKSFFFFDLAIKIDRRYFDAHYNKAIALYKNNRIEDALVNYLQSHRIIKEHEGAILGVGQCYAELGQLDKTIATFEDFIKNNNQCIKIKYQLGKFYLDIHSFEKAELLLKECSILNPDNRIYTLTYVSVLESLSLQEEALKQTLKLLKYYPFDCEIHNRVFEFLWNSNSVDYFVEYRKAYQANSSDPLMIDYARKLIKLNDLVMAKKVLKDYIGHANDDEIPFIMLAHVLRESGEFKQALLVLDKVPIGCNINEYTVFERVVTLLCLGEYQKALLYAEMIYFKSNPTQGTIALYSSVLRICNRQSEYSKIFNFNELIRVYDFLDEVGEGLHNELIRDVLAMHGSDRHPVEQSLRSGSQTKGELFNQNIPSISKLKGKITSIIEAHIKSSSSELREFFCLSNTDFFKFSGSWSINLRDNGFHVNHYHNAGIFSGCYYLVTSGVSNGGEGWLKFGQPELSRWLEFDAEYLVRPEVGRLVIFPSYMWHGTTPMSVSGQRLTIAFDIVPI
ncbi:2OG-Fe(II) oxygenase family protein [Shewanella oncorhynchi]|uniref:2OG-Fe(II) oxygenase family protein n=1 Tax=Shewanella oncorhynchi TaxID=2726434 RepID=UPI003D7AEDF8